ncbi:hypothetical protein [Mesobacillus jeotgali]|uniref:DUF2441 domain-containing protein n=1 Tax=Mesobacillus jeotgali TaxID=129985 RepID=A0ABY9VHW6_9BACI|nr:hypothetical protein [Mesobacillus jeotgali]WNF23168.1 hypothetical protein RH061_01175 [Mesobacillus jeotgali]
MMKQFFHLDRRGMLAEGQTLNLKPIEITTDYHDIKEHAHILFPEGVSMHGDFYLNKVIPQDSHSEWFYEYVRRAGFNQRPSRFQSVFAFETLEDLEKFKIEREIEESIPVFLVECDKFFRADMNLISYNPSPLSMSCLAYNYWSGETNEDINKRFGIEPLWENLLVGPVHVLARI